MSDPTLTIAWAREWLMSATVDFDRGEFMDHVERILAARTSTATADTGLRERDRRIIADLKGRWDGLAGRIAPHIALADVRAALDATAAPTTDAGARDE